MIQLERGGGQRGKAPRARVESLLLGPHVYPGKSLSFSLVGAWWSLVTSKVTSSSEGDDSVVGPDLQAHPDTWDGRIFWFKIPRPLYPFAECEEGGSIFQA